MQIETAEALIQALRVSGLFSSEQFGALVRELAPLARDLQVVLKYLINSEHLTPYQLRKILHGKTADLFLGPYVISDKLGEGGMGRVYRAWQSRIGKEVALKVVRPNLLANPIIRRRYALEVETASKLRHPNIVGVVDAGEIEGRYYLALDFVDGVDLAKLSREYRPLEVAEACEYARQTALGLQHAHEAGFVHRDIKPSNIIVSGERHVPQATEPALVKILDMGLVRAVGFEDGGNGGNDLTRDGTVVGTPDFMAPEQAKNSSSVDHRADLYSLGCTLYYLLAGQPPFLEGTPIEKLMKHQLDTPLALQGLRPEIPSEVAAVVVRLMAKKPEKRYQTALEVASVLAPLSLYRDGSPAAPMRVRRGQSLPVPESAPASSRGSGAPLPLSGSSVPVPGPARDPIPLAQPVAPSDHTPRPVGAPGPLHAEPASPFSSLNDPPSGPFTVAQPAPANSPKPYRNSSRKPLWPWLVLTTILLAAIGVGLWVALNPADPKTPHTPGGTQPGGDPSTKPPTRPGIVPNVNFARLHPQQSLILDGSGVVVVAYPSAYLKEKDSAYSKGAGPGKLSQWATKFTNDTGMPLSRADRVVVSVPAANPDQYMLVAESDAINAKFGDGLVPPKFRPLGEPKGDKPPVRFFALGGGRQSCLFTPAVGQPLYAVASGPGLIGRLQPRFAPGGKNASPNLAPGMLVALEVTGDNPPLFHVVVGASCKVPTTRRLPFGFRGPAPSRTLKEYGLDLLTLKVRIGERMEIEVTATGADADKVKQALIGLAAWLNEEHPRYGSAIADLLLRGDRTGETVEGHHRLTIKAVWTPDQWSAFIEKLLAR